MAKRPLIQFGRLGDPIRIDCVSGKYFGVTYDAVDFLERAARTRPTITPAYALFIAMYDSSWNTLIRHLCTLVGSTPEWLSSVLRSTCEGGPDEGDHVRELQELANAAVTIAKQAHDGFLAPEHLLLAILEAKRGDTLGKEFQMLVGLAREAIRSFICPEGDSYARLDQLLTNIIQARDGDADALLFVLDYYEERLVEGAETFGKQFGVSAEVLLEPANELARNAVGTFKGTTLPEFRAHLGDVLVFGLAAFCTKKN